MVVSSPLSSLSPTTNGRFLAVGRDHGYSVYLLTPLREVCRRTLPNTIGVRLISVGAETPLVALVGCSTKDWRRQSVEGQVPTVGKLKHSGPADVFGPNEVYLLNDATGEVLARLMYEGAVRSIQLSEWHLFVITDTSVHCHALESLTHLVSFPITGHVQCHAVSGGRFIVATTTNTPGELSIRTCQLDPDMPLEPPAIKERCIVAHRTPVSCFALSADGLLVATVSDHGTLIRVFDVASGVEVGLCRRGHSAATVTSLGFNQGANRLLCHSTNGTVHVFDVEGCKNVRVQGGEGRSKLRELRSFAKYHLPAPEARLRAHLLVLPTVFFLILENGCIHEVGYSSAGDCTVRSVTTLG
ncbi:WD40 repeat protein [Giardia muris]|uniref:WD40 repeat protein n=1 Tax=Giardia muris TaxID=5742 RepID=A0A4Z1SNX5_GIAMU|nr:WD40 repeat protein [Giardia muris]|eukprot:TNJ27330.1 WD40 repeat protein [Giardia muris]